MAEVDESPELQSLRSFYADLDPDLVESVWNKNDQDYKVSMEELAEIAKNPGAAGELGDAHHLRPPTSRSAADLGSPSGSTSSRPPAHQTEDAAFSWDTVAATLTDWGQTVSDSIIGLADNISDFVADLASAVDAGWEGDEEQQPAQKPDHRQPRDAAIVTHGGLESQRVNNRKQPVAASHATTADKRESDGEGDDSKYD